MLLLASPAVSNHRQSRWLDRGGAAQSRMALRAMALRPSCARRLRCSCVPYPAHYRERLARSTTVLALPIRSRPRPIVTLPVAQRPRHVKPLVRISRTIPELSNSGSLPGIAGGFPIHLNYRIDASTNLLSWVTLTNVVNSAGTFDFIDSDATDFPRRFYRVHSSP
jgi:hypothetical protein